MWVVLQALGAIAGIVLLLALGSGVLFIWSKRKLRTLHRCEYCWTKPAAFLANFDEAGVPVGMCDDCRKRKLGPFLTESWLKKGKLVRVG